jgi:hypothetical protein
MTGAVYVKGIKGHEPSNHGRETFTRRAGPGGQHSGSGDDSELQEAATTSEFVERLHGREADLHSADDCAEVQRLCRSRVPGATSPEIVHAAAEALERDAEARVAAKEALVAVQKAWGGGPGETVVDWVGLPREEIEQSLLRALGEQPAVTATGGASATDG